MAFLMTKLLHGICLFRLMTMRKVKYTHDKLGDLEMTSVSYPALLFPLKQCGMGKHMLGNQVETKLPGTRLTYLIIPHISQYQLNHLLLVVSIQQTFTALSGVCYNDSDLFSILHLLSHLIS